MSDVYLFGQSSSGMDPEGHWNKLEAFEKRQVQWEDTKCRDSFIERMEGFSDRCAGTWLSANDRWARTSDIKAAIRYSQRNSATVAEPVKVKEPEQETTVATPVVQAEAEPVVVVAETQPVVAETQPVVVETAPVVVETNAVVVETQDEPENQKTEEN